MKPIYERFIDLILFFITGAIITSAIGIIFNSCDSIKAMFFLWILCSFFFVLITSEPYCFVSND